MGTDITHVLDRVLWREVFHFVGKDSHRSVAGTSPLFGSIYREVYDTCTSSAEEMVQTVSGAELFLRETSAQSRFRIKEDDLWTGDRLYSSLEFIHFTAALNGRLELLQWSVAQGFSLDDPDTCAFAAYGGNLSVLQWTRANGSPWGPETCYYAALNGNLALLQWARANGCPWNDWTCDGAALNGHLAVLQWARGNGCPWDSGTCAYAALNGHLAVLQWARVNGCPWNSVTCLFAARNGHLLVLQWARANGCPWMQ